MSCLLPIQPTILGASPGATLVLVTVREDMCVIVRTQAGPMNGAPMNPETVLMRHARTMSK